MDTAGAELAFAVPILIPKIKSSGALRIVPIGHDINIKPTSASASIVSRQRPTLILYRKAGSCLPWMWATVHIASRVTHAQVAKGTTLLWIFVAYPTADLGQGRADTSMSMEG